MLQNPKIQLEGTAIISNCEALRHACLTFQDNAGRTYVISGDPVEFRPLSTPVGGPIVVDRSMLLEPSEEMRGRDDTSIQKRGAVERVLENQDPTEVWGGYKGENYTSSSGRLIVSIEPG